MKTVKDYSAGEEVYYFDKEEQVVVLGYIHQGNKKAKVFVPYTDESVSIRLSECLDCIYKKNELPEEVKDLVVENACEDDFNNECCFNTDDFDVVVELDTEDDIFDALDVFIEYAKSEEKNIICKLVYPDKEEHFFVVSGEGVLLGVFTNEEEAVCFVEDLDCEEDEETPCETEDTEEDSEEEVKYEDEDFISEVEEEISAYLDCCEDIREKVCSIIDSLDHMETLEEVLFDILNDIKKNKKND